MGKFELLC